MESKKKWQVAAARGGGGRREGGRAIAARWRCMGSDRSILVYDHHDQHTFYVIIIACVHAATVVVGCC